MANLADNFDADTSADWAHSGGNAGFPTFDAVWDSGELALSWDADDALIVYDTVPGSIDHEVQATMRLSATTLEHCASAAPRMSGGDAYFLAVATDYRAAFLRYNGGSFSVVRYIDLNDGADYAAGDAAAEPDASDWVTVRIAAEGAAGANVTLSLWWQIHGASKPGSDPGWIGTDGSPQFSIVDSNASRLDDTAHVNVGIAGLQNSGATRMDWWKARAISDRPAGGVSILPQMLANH